jgi:ABC-type transporter Mla maintaining outer membrane lipid asymmetry ATPase subunit MlaF
VTGVPATISVRDLRKCYGPVRAVDGVSFDVRHGEFFGILGPNGAGKTTALEIVEGLRQADGGTVSVLGLPAWPRNQALLPRIGVQLGWAIASGAAFGAAITLVSWRQNKLLRRLRLAPVAVASVVTARIGVSLAAGTPSSPSAV